jgi:hypothetical protein
MYGNAQMQIERKMLKRFAIDARADAEAVRRELSQAKRELAEARAETLRRKDEILALRERVQSMVTNGVEQAGRGRSLNLVDDFPAIGGLAIAYRKLMQTDRTDLLEAILDTTTTTSTTTTATTTSTAHNTESKAGPLAADQSDRLPAVNSDCGRLWAETPTAAKQETRRTLEIEWLIGQMVVECFNCAERWIRRTRSKMADVLISPFHEPSVAHETSSVAQTTGSVSQSSASAAPTTRDRYC